jgi:hypothetical protein
LLQIIQQREPLFQILQVMLLHTRSFTRR